MGFRAESSQEIKRGSRLWQGWESLALRGSKSRIPPGIGLYRSRSENCCQTTCCCICLSDNTISCTLFINKHDCANGMLNFLNFLIEYSGNACNNCHIFQTEPNTSVFLQLCFSATSLQTAKTLPQVSLLPYKSLDNRSDYFAAWYGKAIDSGAMKSWMPQCGAPAGPQDG